MYMDRALTDMVDEEQRLYWGQLKGGDVGGDRASIYASAKRRFDRRFDGIRLAA